MDSGNCSPDRECDCHPAGGRAGGGRERQPEAGTVIQFPKSSKSFIVMAVAKNGKILFSSGSERGTGNKYEGRNLADIAITPSTPVLDAIKKSSITRIMYHTINQAVRSSHMSVVTPALYRSADETDLAAIVRQFDVFPKSA